MAAKTLFDAAKPIIFVLNFMGYGLGWETRKGSRWVKVLKIHATVVLFIIFLAAFSTLMGEIKMPYIGCHYTLRGFLLLSTVPCLDYYLLLNESQLGNLVRQFRLFPVKKESGKALKKCLLPFYFYLVINIMPFILYCGLVFTMFSDDVKKIIINCLLLWLLLCLFLSVFLLLMFPVFLCYFACLVPIYCVARVKELVQEIKSARSSLRRAKMTSDLMREYYRLKRLASMTDETVSKAMSLFHLMFVIGFALTVAIGDGLLKATPNFDDDRHTSFSEIHLLIIPFFVHVFPFLMYKRVAPLANQMHSLIFEALVEIALIDDQWLSRDPILRPLLIKMRVSHVFHVAHIVLEEASFTLFGEAIEGESLFTIFLESIDMYNTISVPASHESVSLVLKVATTFSGDRYYIGSLLT